MIMSSSRGLSLSWTNPPFSMSYPRRRWIVLPSWPVISCIRAAARPESAVWAKDLPRRTFRTPATTVLLPVLPVTQILPLYLVRNIWDGTVKQYLYPSLERTISISLLLPFVIRETFPFECCTIWTLYSVTILPCRSIFDSCTTER